MSAANARTDGFSLTLYEHIDIVRAAEARRDRAAVKFARDAQGFCRHIDIVEQVGVRVAFDAFTDESRAEYLETMLAAYELSQAYRELVTA